MFVGPTGIGISAEVFRAAGVTVHAPAERGSFEPYLDGCPPQTLVLVDGVFDQVLSVSHKEIMAALAVGHHIWGLSSMGAIRAAELATFGMCGFGSVYNRFMANPEMPDDEVALLHAPPPLSIPISEPLVHLIDALAYLRVCGMINEACELVVVQCLRSMWFGDRTIASTVQLIARYAGQDRADAVALALADFTPFRTKTHDLAAFLQEQPWRN